MACDELPVRLDDDRVEVLDSTVGLFVSSLKRKIHVNLGLINKFDID